MILTCALIAISIVVLAGSAAWLYVVLTFFRDIRKDKKKPKTTHQPEIHRVFQIDH